MQFKHPELLYALFLLLIPVIVHLFQLRRFKKEAFTNVAFLKYIAIQTRKSSQLKKWLTLLTRLLALAAIILAFAQPFSSKSTSYNTTQETVIWLDNSFSMQKKGPNGELLKRAVQELIENISPSKTFSLFTNTTVYKNTNIKAIQNDLLQLDYTPEYLDYNAALLKGHQLFSKENVSSRELVLISDFQEQNNSFQPKADSLANLNLVQLHPVNNNNILLDSLYLSKTTASSLELSVVVKNFGSNAEDLPISLLNNEKLIAKTSISKSDKNIATFSLQPNEVINGKVSIEDSNLGFDNTLYFNINKKAKVNVLAISDSSDSFLKRIFTENEFNYTNQPGDAVDFNSIEQQNLIILNELKTISNALSMALIEFTRNGGSIVVIPSEKATTENYNTFLASNSWILNSFNNTEKKITSVNYSHPIYLEVFDGKVNNFQYPKVEGFFPLKASIGATMLSFEDGKPFLIQQNKSYLFTAPLNEENSNFIHSDLVVTLYAIARNSLKPIDLYYTIGNQNTFDVDVSLKQDEVITLSSIEQTVIPQQQYFNNKVTISTSETPEIAGIYAITSKTDTLQNVSFNYNRKESNMSYQTFGDIQGITVSDSVSVLMDSLKNDSKIKELWKWFVIFALIFLLIEMLILKYLK